MRNNVWLGLTATLMATWETWFAWHQAPEDSRGPEPPLASWDKDAIQFLVDVSFSFSAFKQAIITRFAPKDQWRLLSFYDVAVPEWIDAGISQHGLGDEGGDLWVYGIWSWRSGDAICKFDNTVIWNPHEVVLYMPSTCVLLSPQYTCESWLPAEEITDITLIAGQPNREFPG